MAGEEKRGLAKFVLLTTDGQRQKQIEINFFGLEVCYLHPEMAKTFSNFIMSEITNYFIEVAADEEAWRHRI